MTKKSRRAKTRRALLSLSLVLVMMMVAVGGTLAWLTATSTPVTNTFTTSDIGVELEETTTDYKMIPGYDISKDPKASITDGSEAAWLFVKIEKSANFDDYMTYEVADGWTLVTGEPNVYARKVATADIGKKFSVLKSDKVTVKGEVTKAMMETAMTSQPTLTFTAYASQLMKNATTEFTAGEAWENLNPTPAAE